MRNKALCSFLLVFLFFVSLSSATITVDKVDKGSVVISELNNPAVFDIKIHSDISEKVELYTLVSGIETTPKEFFDIHSGDNNVEVMVYLSNSIRQSPGNLIFEYQIKGQQSGIFKDTLRVEIISLENAVSVTSHDILPGDDKAVITLKNTRNANLNEIDVKVDSDFFSDKRNISLKPYQEVSYSVDINKDRIRNLKAGEYSLTAEIGIGDFQEKVVGELRYLERENIVVTEQSSGFLIRKNSITKTNEGSIPTKVDVSIQKEVFSRLFTVYSTAPEISDRNGLFVNYVWSKEIAPGESYTIESTTNYVFPFILIILVIVIALVTHLYLRTSLVLNKKVSFVRTKGGEMALKVTIRARARKYLTNVVISDRWPMSTKVYDKFGKMPDVVDEKGRQMHWNISSLNPGEERTFSYIIYSTVKIFGRFELPSSHAAYDREGKREHVASNRAFFVAGSR